MADTDEVRSLYLRLLRSWNGRDAGGMAECFSSDGVMIGFDGSVAEGREAIRDHLSPIFDDHPTPAFTAIIRAVRMIEGVGVLLADVGMVPPGTAKINPAANARQAMVARAEGGRWRIELFQNTPAALHRDEEGREALSAELSAAFAGRGLLPDR